MKTRNSSIIFQLAVIKMAVLLTGILFIINGCSKNDSPKKVLNRDIAQKFGVFSPKKNVAAPNFRLQSLNGEYITLSKYTGKLLFLNFSTTW
jgi:hypothetical protein